MLPYHVRIALNFVGTHERGYNRGPEIDRWNRHVGNPLGSSYCGAFVGYCDDSAGVISPRPSGLAIGYRIRGSIRAEDVLAGRVLVPDGSIFIMQHTGSWHGHTGFVIQQLSNRRFETVEANTSSGVRGSQDDGDGVWRRFREIQPFSHFRIRYFTPVAYSS